MADDRIERIWPHLGNMTPDEIRDQIRKTRNDRKIKKVRASTVKKETKQREAKKDKTKDILKGLSPEAIQRIIEGLS